MRRKIAGAHVEEDSRRGPGRAGFSPAKRTNEAPICTVQLISLTLIPMLVRSPWFLCESFVIYSESPAQPSPAQPRAQPSPAHGFPFCGPWRWMAHMLSVGLESRLISTSHTFYQFYLIVIFWLESSADDDRPNFLKQLTWSCRFNYAIINLISWNKFEGNKKSIRSNCY